MKWRQRNEYYWVRECGRYYVERSFSADRWVHLAWFKRLSTDAIVLGGDDDTAGMAVCISPKARLSFQAAAADCAAHLSPQHQARRDAA